MLCSIVLLVLSITIGNAIADRDIYDRFAALENIVLSQQKENTAQQREIAELKQIVTSQQNQISELQYKCGADKKQTDVVAQTLGNQKRFVLDAIETVAFEATIAGGKSDQHNNIHDRIRFEDVSLNVGNGYYPGNGTFIAPVSGIYIFSTSVMMTEANTNDLNMHVIIEKNGVEIAGAFAYNQGAYEHSSVTAAMDLKQGDSVYVSVERHNDITFYGDRLTSFTGFLLYPY